MLEFKIDTDCIGIRLYKNRILKNLSFCNVVHVQNSCVGDPVIKSGGL